MYSSDNDLSFLAVDAEHQMAKFLAKTLRVCSGNVLTNVVGVNGKVSNNN